MKRLSLCLLCLLGQCCVLPALAQDAASPGPNAAEHQRIDEARAQAMADFNAEDIACYQRFAVSGCLKQVQSRRRAVLADLKKQEALLQEQERAGQAAEQRRSLAQKALERQQLEADIRADNAAGRAAEKLLEQQEKQAAHAAKAQAPAASAAAPAAPIGPGATEQASNRESYARKQLDAEKKRQDIAKRLAEKDSKPAAPLPVPK